MVIDVSDPRLFYGVDSVLTFEMFVDVGRGHFGSGIIGVDAVLTGQDLGCVVGYGFGSIVDRGAVKISLT